MSLEIRPLNKVVELLNEYAFDIVQSKLVEDLRIRFGYYNVETDRDDIIIKLGFESSYEFFINNIDYISEETENRGFTINDFNIDGTDLQLNDFVVFSPIYNFDFKTQFLDHDQFSNKREYKSYIIDLLKEYVF
jgi:hypothetical protein